MFENLSASLEKISNKLKKRSLIKEADVDEEVQEIRAALLDADVALMVVKEFTEAVRIKSVGQRVLNSVTPGQMIVKIVHDELVDLLGGSTTADLNFSVKPPATILLAGLQGSGKTTTAAKLANRLNKLEKKRVLMASLDVYRPAAQQQLEVLGQQIGVNVLDTIFGEKPVAISTRAIKAARLEGYDAVILDTAGRLHLDQPLMTELLEVSECTKPAETLLVVDSMTGQDAVNLASEFNKVLELSGIVLTRVDGDARGGAALSMRAITGKPIKFIGNGETISDIDLFDASRVANSILGMGDIVGLVEKAQTLVDTEAAEKSAKKLLKGQFNLDDMAEQLDQLKKMGSLEGVLAMLPGAQKAKAQMAQSNITDHALSQQEAIIRSMTKAERRNPKVLNGSRRKRIASGSGTTVQDVNKLLKQFKQMQKMFKKVGKRGAMGISNILSSGTGGIPPPRLH